MVVLRPELPSTRSPEHQLTQAVVAEVAAAAAAVDTAVTTMMFQNGAKITDRNPRRKRTSLAARRASRQSAIGPITELESRVPVGAMRMILLAMMGGLEPMAHQADQPVLEAEGAVMDLLHLPNPAGTVTLTGSTSSSFRWRMWRSQNLESVEERKKQEAEGSCHGLADTKTLAVCGIQSPGWEIGPSRYTPFVATHGVILEQNAVQYPLSSPHVPPMQQTWGRSADVMRYKKIQPRKASYSVPSHMIDDLIA